MNKKHLSLALAAALGAGLSTSAFAYGVGDFFGPVPTPIQQAMGGLSIGVGQFHQNYAEHATSGSGLPNPLDTQTGNITAFHIGYAKMGPHFGYNVAYNVGTGNTTYNGYLQNVNTSTGQVTLTPYTTTTQSLSADLHATIRGGFSPIKDFAVIPNVFIGQHGWHRAIQGIGGYTENYYNQYYGVGLTLAGAVPQPGIPLVLQVKYKAGHTHHAYMTSNISNDTAYLGSKPWTQYGVEVDYMPRSNLTVYLSYMHTKFKYGQSQIFQTEIGPAFEPNSTTKQNVTLLGIKYRF
ncbi:hypothetical protein [Acidihalobacter ferrooxydans]|uniref:Outer membrane protein beta-barrel domain-containing protein n=1 Tax=Acidihalobacter ferrooxydans TaxID=1765967 RepID=A0A1P8UKK3_9GAMM|nr:hypothetical protein [Acidihalobacter ferrooxydans]APZ44353.1 hypothetical protein BW247_15705 [Acidihalobacter ferrooxydans]